MFKRKENGGFFRIFLISLFTSMGMGLFLLFITANYFTGNNDASQLSQAQNTPAEPTRPEPAKLEPQRISNDVARQTPVVATVAKTASPGVVGISVLRIDSNDLFAQDATEKWGVGSGVIVSEGGYILTNHHVAGGKSKRIVISLHDGRNIDGVTQWSDAVLDLAVVKVNAENLTTIPLGNSDRVEVGETAVAIGNPLGLQFQRTVTSGIVSALNRTIEIETEQGRNFMEDLIQTDASINPGNSGGPLLNSKGEVIGINTVKVTTAEGIGFAVPINVAVPILQKFIGNGEFVETYLGVFAYDKEIIPFLNSEVKIDNGIYVANVDENGPAYKSGIRVGCIISEVDGIKMNTMMQLRTYIYSKNPGDTINVTHLAKDENKFITVPIKLAAKEKDGLITR
jgi:serine protease Do